MASSAFPSLDGTLGAIEIGAVVSTFLLGIETLQAYHYFDKYPKDSRFLKAMVAIIVLFEFGHTISLWHAVYSVTVTFYGQLQHLQSPPHSLEIIILFSLTINGVVQSFFAGRVWKFSRNITIPLICWALALIRVVCNIAMMAIQWGQPDLSTLQSKFRWLVSLTLAAGVAVDVLVALSMCYWLSKIPRSGFEVTTRMVHSLLKWTIETGVITSATSALLLIMFLARSDFVWFTFYLVQAKLYANSLLFSLNSRQMLRSPFHLEVDFSTARENMRFTQSAERNPEMVIQMSRVTETDDKTHPTSSD